jgi:hypothetical protein
VLRFSLGGNAFRAVVSGCFVGAAGYMSGNMWLHPELGDSRKAGLIGVQGLAVLLMLCALYFLWMGAFSLWRMFIHAPALELHDAFVATNRSFLGKPRTITLSSIVDAAFDRADRIHLQYGTIEKAVLLGGPVLIPGSSGAFGGAWGARQSAKCRTIMQIIYQDENRIRSLRLMNNQVEGGKWAMARFVRDLRKELGKTGLGRARPDGA